MADWWSGLTAMNQTFYAIAVFFSTIFVWQFLSSLSALGGEATEVADDASGDLGGDVDGDTAGADLDDLVDDASGLATFRLLSVRSILAFGTLFSWAGALYLQQGIGAGGAMLRAFLWGMAGMVVVGAFFWVLPRLAEEGTSNLSTAVGRTAQVYMDIPEDGVGQVRVVFGGRLQFVRARTEDGKPLKAGSTVLVVRQLDSMLLQVRRITGEEVS